MASINPPNRATSSKHKLREDQFITAYAKGWGFFDRHRKLVYGALAAVVILILLVVGYVLFLNRQQNEAVREMTEAVAAYERGDLRTALDGTGEWPGLLEIVDEYGSTDAGNLATFYAADALYKLGDYDLALEMFEEFDKEPNLLGASAIAGEAAVYESQGEYERAAELYERAAVFFESELTTPAYLFNAGRAYENAGAYEEAIQIYEEVRERFPDTVQAGTVDFFIGRAQARAAQPS